MLTSKQRARLRGMANTLQPLTQIGKGGVSPAVAAQASAMLEAHELIKLAVLDAADMTAREACGELCAACGAEPVQVIGNRLVIFKKRAEDSKFDL